MSRSRNTEKESVRAARRIRRDEDGEACLPRIIVRKPKCGDVHPLPKSILVRLLKNVPVEYIYGLRASSYVPDREISGIPLAPMDMTRRPSSSILRPGCGWVIDLMSEDSQRNLEAYHAKVSQRGRQWHVYWPSEAGLALWFFNEVFTHELGHHFAEQYKKKRGRIRGLRFREMNANLRSSRVAHEVMACIRRRRQRKQDKQIRAPGLFR